MRGRSFDRLLERCLEEAVRTGDIEVALARYPKQARELRPLLEMALTVNKRYADVPEPARQLRVGRERLLRVAARQRAEMLEGAHAQNTRYTKKGQRGPMLRIAFATKLIAVILSAVMGTTALGGGTAWAALESLPGDLLYPVKIALEDTRLNLADSLEDRLELALEFAGERVEEAGALTDEDRPIPEATAIRAEEQIRFALGQAGEATLEQAPGLFLRIAEDAEGQIVLLMDIDDDLDLDDHEVLISMREAFEQGRDEALEAAGESDSDEDQDGDVDVDSDEDEDQDSDADSVSWVNCIAWPVSKSMR